MWHPAILINNFKEGDHTGSHEGDHTGSPLLVGGPAWHYNDAMRHVYLIGLPGCGKTTLGALAAKALGLPFYDMDEYLEEKTGRTIAELFAYGGEAAFREIESEALKDIAKNRPGIVATGGGTPILPRNAPILREGLVIFIDRPPEEIAKTVDW